MWGCQGWADWLADAVRAHKYTHTFLLLYIYTLMYTTSNPASLRSRRAPSAAIVSSPWRREEFSSDSWRRRA